MNTSFHRPPSLTLPLKGGGETGSVSHLWLSLCEARAAVSDEHDLLPPPLRGRAGEGGKKKTLPLRHEHPESLPRAKRLRGNLTDAEHHLWSRLRRRQLDGYRFRRQMPLGSFVADFACPAEKLVVELDGGQHVADAARDRSRDAWLAERGYRVLRFWNNDVMRDTNAVLAENLRALEGGE